MDREYYLNFLIRLDTTMQRGEVYTAGDMAGQNISDYYNSLTERELAAEYQQYVC